MIFIYIIIYTISIIRIVYSPFLTSSQSFSYFSKSSSVEQFLYHIGSRSSSGTLKLFYFIFFFKKISKINYYVTLLIILYK